jgi:hypothetical protein
MLLRDVLMFYIFSFSYMRKTWRHNIERTVAKALRTYVRTYSLFRREHLSTNIKLTLYKALIRFVMIYACPIWEHVADVHPLKLQRLQNRVLRAVGNLKRCTPVRELHVDFKIPYVYDYITSYAGHSRSNLKPCKSKCTWYWTRKS